MNIYEVVLSNRAEKDRAFWKKNLPKDYNKLLRLLQELREHPTWGTGHPEPLTGIENGWSRHINKKDVLKYEIQETKVLVTVLSARGHYDDH